MGNDPVSGKQMVVKDAASAVRHDGEYNASLRKSDSVEELTDERAAEAAGGEAAKGPGSQADDHPQAGRGEEAGCRKKATAAKKPAAKKAPAKAQR